MAIPFEKIVAEDLQLGYGPQSVTMPAGGSAVGSKVGLHTILPNVISALATGAVGDGTTDETAAFHAAIVALPAAGGTVVVPPGSYLLKTTLTLDRPVVLQLHRATLTFQTSPGISVAAAGAGSFIEGIGRLSTLQTLATSNFLMVNLQGTTFVKVRNVRCYGNAVATDPANPVVGIDINQSHGCEVTGCTFENLNYGVRLIDTVAPASTNPARNNVHDNHFVNAYGVNNGGYGLLHVRSVNSTIHDNNFGPGPFDRHCIYISAGSRKVIVSGNICDNATLAPISVNSGVTAGDEIQEVSITDNTIYGPNAVVANSHGISITGGFVRSVVSLNKIFGAGQYGILVQAASPAIVPSQIIIATNFIYHAQQIGILATDTIRLLLSGNQIIESGQQGAATYASINLSNVGAVTSDAVVHGNIAFGAQTSYGIAIGAGVVNTFIAGNDLNSNPSGAFTDGGTTTRFGLNFTGTAGDELIGGMTVRIAKSLNVGVAGVANVDGDAAFSRSANQGVILLGSAASHGWDMGALNAGEMTARIGGVQVLRLQPGGLGTGRIPRVALQGTPLVNGDFSVSGGWGATPTINVVSNTNSCDSKGEVSITAGGAGIAANPTVTLTFKDGTWGSVPYCLVIRNDANAPAAIAIVSAVSATQLTFQLLGLPVNGTTYNFQWIVIG